MTMIHYRQTNDGDEGMPDKDSNATAIAAAIGVIVIIALVLMSPFVTIWSLNTLFKLDIQYTFWTWSAMLWINVTISGARYKGYKNV